MVITLKYGIFTKIGVNMLNILKYTKINEIMLKKYNYTKIY